MPTDQATASRGSAVGPLTGVRVLDLTRFQPGAYCTATLADLGADVIRLESPSAAGQRSLVTGQVGLARGKRSVTLDLRHERGNEVLARLAGAVDVVVENNSPGELDRRGYGYTQASAQHPRLIWCSITGFGQEGPYASWPGHDLTYAGQSGLIGVLTPDLPWTPRWMLAVPMGAMTAVAGISSALFERTRTGKGCQLDISLAESATWMLGGLDGALTDTPMLVPLDPGRRLYQCGDGKWITIAAAEPRTWSALCNGIGAADLAAKMPTTPDERETATAKLSALFASKTAAEWVAHLGPLGAAIGPLNVGGDVVRDPHNAARGATVEVGGVAVPANPIRVRGGDGARSTTATAPPPLVGEHTDEVLREAGLSTAEIDALRAGGVI